MRTKAYWGLREAMYHPEKWTQEYLQRLEANELVDLCRLFGIAYYGTNEEKITRLLNSNTVRQKLSKYGGDNDASHDEQWETINQMKQDFKLRELDEMCKLVGASRALNDKTYKARSLLGWRNACRRRGQEFYKQARANLEDKIYQLVMPI